MGSAPIREADLERMFSDDGNLASHLDTYVRAVEAGMNGWLQSFEWDKQVLLDRYQVSSGEPSASGLALRTCPFNSAHAKIKQENFESHVQRCRLKSLGLTAEDIVRAKSIYSTLNRLLLFLHLLLILFLRRTFRCRAARIQKAASHVAK